MAKGSDCRKVRLRPMGQHYVANNPLLREVRRTISADPAGIPHGSQVPCVTIVGLAVPGIAPSEGGTSEIRDLRVRFGFRSVGRVSDKEVGHQFPREHNARRATHERDERRPRAMNDTTTLALIQQFLNYLTDERHFSPYTGRCYGLDLRQFVDFIESKGGIKVDLEKERKALEARSTGADTVTGRILKCDVIHF